MLKTTIYLPEDLKRKVTLRAEREGRSEAEVIRAAIEAAVGEERPRPRGGLFSSGDPIGDRIDEFMKGFGEH